MATKVSNLVVLQLKKKAVSRANQFNSIKRLFSMNDLKKRPSKLAEATKK